MVTLPEMPRYDKYKDSGIEWVGDIPSEWEMKPLKRLVRIHNGVDHKRVLADDGYPVYGSGGIFAYASDYLYNGKAILFGRKGTIDKPLFVDGKFWTVDTMFYATNRYPEVISDKFVYYFATTIPYKFYSTSTALPSMTQTDLNNNPVIIPCFETQSSIVSFLDKKVVQIEEAVGIKEKQIALLKERKQIIIQKAVTKGLNPDLPMKYSGVDWIGKIPEHWEVIKLKYLFKEVNDRTDTGEETLLSLRMDLGLIPHDEVSDKQVLDKDLIGYKRVFPGQMIMNRMRAAIGIFGIPRIHGLVSPDYAVFDVIQKINLEYFLLLFKTSLLGTQFRLNSKGLGTGSSGFMRLYSENFGDIKVPYCSETEQTEIFQFIEAETNKINNSIELIHDQIEKLKEYKTTLINNAVTGKIKVA